MGNPSVGPGNGWRGLLLHPQQQLISLVPKELIDSNSMDDLAPDQVGSARFPLTDADEPEALMAEGMIEHPHSGGACRMIEHSITKECRGFS